MPFPFMNYSYPFGARRANVDIHDNSTTQLGVELEGDEEFEFVSKRSLDLAAGERRYHYEPLNLSISPESLMSSFPPQFLNNGYIKPPNTIPPRVGSDAEEGGEMQLGSTLAENNGFDGDAERLQEMDAPSPAGVPSSSGSTPFASTFNYNVISPRRRSMKRASNSFARPIDTPDGRDERTSKDGLPWDIRPVPHAEIDELGSEHEDEESRTSGTSEPEQNRARPSSPHPPSESLNEILQSLLVALTKSRGVRSPLINDDTLLLFRKLLDIPDATVALCMKNNSSDVEAFLDFLLYILREGSLSNCIIQDANRKTRRLMSKLVSKTDVMPSSLFITDVEKDPQAIAVGGFGKVFMGKRGGQLVALKMLFRGRHDSIEKEFYKEALAWRSLSHRFILPLLGIYEEGPQLFLVSSFMTNGTLRDWRRQQAPVRIDEIGRLLLEVAEGFQYIHSEGIVHGDLHGDNVLLDSEFHCQITDFGSTRHSEATVARSTTALTHNYAAPELFGVCTKCCQYDCDGSHDGPDKQHRIKTMKTDVYAFGCLYYAIFFDTVPFHGKNIHQITRLVTQGVRPDRLKNPIMEDFRWDLIQKCWKSNPCERPTMELMAVVLTPLTLAPAF